MGLNVFTLYKYHAWVVEMSFPVGEGDVWSLNMLRCKFQGLWLSNTAPQRRLPSFLNCTFIDEQQNLLFSEHLI